MGKIIDRIKALNVSSPRSRSIALYLIFVCISSILWCIVTFNNTFTADVELPVKIVSKPANVHFLTQVPDTLTVSVSSRGTSFLKYAFLPSAAIELRFSDYIDGNGQFKVGAGQLKKAIGKLLQGVTVNSVLPGELTARYTDQPGKRVPVVLDIDADAAPMHALTGMIERSQDSVLVYGDSKTLKSIQEVYTFHINALGLTDTLHRKATIASIKGVVIEPRTIDITIPVEKLLSKTQKVKVAVRNAPNDVNVIVFPSKVDVSFRAPVSYYKNSSSVITAVVDYNSININTPGNKVELLIGEVPGAYEDVKLALDSVEYIIEKH